jgi:hypothetical protein
MLLRYRLNDVEIVPVATVITGIAFAFTFHYHHHHHHFPSPLCRVFAIMYLEQTMSLGI